MIKRDVFYLGFGSKESHDWMCNNIRVSSDSINTARKILFEKAGHLPNFGYQDRDFYLFPKGSNAGLAMALRIGERDDIPEIAIYHTLEDGLRDMASILCFSIPEGFEIRR